MTAMTPMQSWFTLVCLNGWYVCMVSVACGKYKCSLLDLWSLLLQWLWCAVHRVHFRWPDKARLNWITNYSQDEQSSGDYSRPIKHNADVVSHQLYVFHGVGDQDRGKQEANSNAQLKRDQTNSSMSHILHQNTEMSFLDSSKTCPQH